MFGWLPQHALSLPWPQFLLMLQEGRRLRAIDLSEQCDLHALAICNGEYYKTLKRHYSLQIEEPEKMPKQPRLPHPHALDSGSAKAKNAIMDMCAIYKRGHY